MYYHIHGWAYICPSYKRNWAMVKPTNLYVNVLKRAKALVSAGWIKHTSAVNGVGDHVSPSNIYACRWCITGALSRAAWEQPFTAISRNDIYHKAADYVHRANDIKSSLPSWNDKVDRKKHHVIEALDNAINYVEAARW